MTKYAAETTVSKQKSRADIEAVLKKYGATGFAFGYDSERAMIAFVLHNRHIRFALPLPQLSDDEIIQTPGHHYRSPIQRKSAYEQAVRQRWRALYLVIKAKLEAVEANISSVESEFFAHLVLPNNRTIEEWLGPQLEEAYERGTVPPLLPMPSNER